MLRRARLHHGGTEVSVGGSGPGRTYGPSRPPGRAPLMRTVGGSETRGPGHSSGVSGRLAGEPVLGGTFRASRESGGSWPGRCPCCHRRTGVRPGWHLPRGVWRCQLVFCVYNVTFVCVLYSLRTVQIPSFFINLGVTVAGT